MKKSHLFFSPLSSLFWIGIVFWLGSCQRAPDNASEPIWDDLISAADARETVPSQELRETSADSNNMARAKEIAIAILNAAAVALPAEAEGFRTMIAALERVQFDVPPQGRDLRQCVRESNVLAFVMTQSRGTIHLCARALHTHNLRKLAQVLVHETTHVVGVDNECQATRIEVTAMRAAQHRLAFQNGYMRRCGIR